jgi:hypothetical protein
MPKRYPSEFQRAVCKRLVAGEKVSALRKSSVFQRPPSTCGSTRP